MKDEIVHFLFPLIVLLIGAAVEELLPKFNSVGFPVLMLASVWFATHRPLAEMLVLAVASGAAQDSLSALPIALTPSYLLAVTALARWSKLPRASFLLAFPLYQFWLAVWINTLSGGLWSRLVVSVPVAAVTAYLLWHVLEYSERRFLGDAR